MLTLHVEKFRTKVLGIFALRAFFKNSSNKNTLTLLS